MLLNWILKHNIYSILFTYSILYYFFPGLVTAPRIRKKVKNVLTRIDAAIGPLCALKDCVDQRLRIKVSLIITQNCDDTINKIFIEDRKWPKTTCKFFCGCFILTSNLFLFIFTWSYESKDIAKDIKVVIKLKRCMEYGILGKSVLVSWFYHLL